MNFKVFDKNDRRILIVSLFLLLLSSLLVFNDGWIYRLTSLSTEDLVPIGRVQQINNDVRRRHEVAFSWLPLQNKNRVYQGDSIFTGQQSGAVIETDSGEQIKIAPNSLVVIKNRADSVSIDIGFGSVEGQVQNGKTLIVTSNNKLTEILAKDALVKIDAGDGQKLVLNVLAGEVNIRSPDGSKTLRRFEALELDTPSAPPEKLIQIQMPLANHRFQHDPNRPVEFRWRTLRPLERMRIKVGLDEDMKNLLVDSSVIENSFTAFDLPVDKKIYWQVLSSSGMSEKSHFYLVGNNPPRPLAPLQGQHIYFSKSELKSESTSVDLVWAEGSPALNYEVQLASSSDFKNSKILKSSKTHMKVADLKTGHYYWRVRSTDFGQFFWSEASHFKVGPEPTLLLTAPSVFKDSQEFIFTVHPKFKDKKDISKLRGTSARSLVESFPQLEWSPVAKAQVYDLEISNKPDFSSVLVRQQIRGTRWSWKTLQTGLFYWRVRARSEFYRNGEFSKPQAISLKIGAPISLIQNVFAEEVHDRAFLNLAPPPLKLKWSQTLLTHGYEVQISEDAQFKSSTRFFTQNNERLVQLAKVGQYYWRVRSLDTANRPLSSWATFSLEFRRFYTDPSQLNQLLALYPRQNESIIVVGQGENEIRFEWTTPDKEAEYQLEIATDRDFKNLLYRGSTKNSYYLLKKPIMAPEIFWRVRATNSKALSDWTTTQKVFVSFEKTPFDYQMSEILHAARIRAKERQEKLLADVQRQLARLRTPASRLDWQLETPQLTFEETFYELESNLDPSWTSSVLVKKRTEDFFSSVKNFPVLTWQKVSAAERYFVEIASDTEFKNIILRAPSYNAYYLWDTARPGAYYWRVQAFNERYTRSNYSVAQPLRIAVAKPALISAETLVETFIEPKEFWPSPQQTRISWTPVVFAKSYEVQVANNRDFKNSQIFKTHENFIDLKVNYSGLYFYRVKALNELNISISRWAEKSIEFIQAQRKPASLNILEGLYPVDRTVVLVGHGDYRLPFYFNPTRTSSFTIELSLTSDFKNILSQVKTKEALVHLPNTLPEGDIYWRVRENEASGQKSKVYNFTLKKVN